MLNARVRWGRRTRGRRWLPADACFCTSVFLLAASLGTALAQPPLSPGASVFDNKEVVLASKYTAAWPDPDTRYCGAEFVDRQDDAVRVRVRLRLPGNRPWTLLTISHCEGHTDCHPDTLKTTASAIVYRGEGAPVERLLGLTGSANFLQLGAKIRNYLRDPKEVQPLFDELMKNPHVRPVGATAAGKGLEIWTAPAHGGRLSHFLLMSGAGCPAELQRTGVIYDDHLRARKVFQPNYDGKLDGRPDDVTDGDLPQLTPLLARIEYIDYSRAPTPSPGKSSVPPLMYCSGLVVAPGVILTARHCIEACLNPSRADECASYAVDFGYLAGKPGRPPRYAGMSLPIASATASGVNDERHDYGFLAFDEHAFASPGLVSAQGPDDLKISAQRIKQVSFPLGHFAQKGACWLYGRDSAGEPLFHTCYTLDGSSGAPLLNDRNQIIGVHVAALQRCDGRPNKNPARARDHAPRLESLNSGGTDIDYCWGEAISVQQMYCSECAKRDKTAAICDIPEVRDFLASGGQKCP